MLFKDVKQGYPLYIFDRSSVSVRTASVSAVSFPHLSSKPNSGMVVDVTINIDGNSQQYEIRDTSECAYVGTIMLSPNVESVLNEIRTLKAQSEEAIKLVDKHKENIAKCTTLLTEFDPVYKEKQATEERLSRIENSIGKLTTIIENMNTKSNMI
jgi:ornithine cyclodeaminase/alanine dehydrogenase-like protein (mu-crystallin family)